MARRLRLLDLGDRASGRVCDPDKWDHDLPEYVRPPRRASGEVIGILANYPEVVTIRTDLGEVVTIRRA